MEMSNRALETSTLIKWLNEIDFKLRNSTYKKRETVVGGLSGKKIALPVMVFPRYSVDELTSLVDRKHEIITELHKRGNIDSSGYKTYLLSEKKGFTPELATNGNK